MRRSIFALGGVAALAAVTALVFGTLAEAGVPATAATQSFTFCSGSASASFAPNGEGPTTLGLGASGDIDPVTVHLGAASTPATPAGPAVIVSPPYFLVGVSLRALDGYHTVQIKLDFRIPTW